MKLKPMIMADAKKMLQWKNYPETRKFAIASHDRVKLKDHLTWLAHNIQFFQIIDNCKGAVRVQHGEVSIWVDRKFWGNGLATKAINAVSKKGYIAKIVDGNIASMRVFVKAGYQPVEYRDGYTIWKK